MYRAKLRNFVRGTVRVEYELNTWLRNIYINVERNRNNLMERITSNFAVGFPFIFASTQSENSTTKWNVHTRYILLSHFIIPFYKGLGAVASYSVKPATYVVIAGFTRWKDARFSSEISILSWKRRSSGECSRRTTIFLTYSYRWWLRLFAEDYDFSLAYIEDPPLQ